MSSTFPCSLGSFGSDDYGINYNSFGVRNTFIARSILQSQKKLLELVITGLSLK